MMFTADMGFSTYGMHRKLGLVDIKLRRGRCGDIVNFM